MSGMPKRWRERKLLARIPLDVPGWSVQVHRITWPDGSECVQVMKYGIQPMTGRDAPYKPMQYVQISTGIAEGVLKQVLDALKGAEQDA